MTHCPYILTEVSFQNLIDFYGETFRKQLSLSSELFL
jgi:hypothetical protein